MSSLRQVAAAEIRARGKLDVRNTRFERCYFHHSRASGGCADSVELDGCTVWSCSLVDVHLRDCVVRDLKTSPGGGGRTAPLFLWGGSARRVTLSGSIGSIVWNPPRAERPGLEPDEARLAEARAFYDTLDDWALDVSQARFRSVPTLRFGPPGRLIRRDPETQPLVTRQAAERALAAIGHELGIWRISLERLVQESWPHEIVLMPALGAAKAKREEQLRALQRLRPLLEADV